MFKITRFSFVFIALFGLISSCSPYQKVLNNPDMAEKYKAAETYYTTGEYRKANRLFEQILPSYRGKPQAQRIIFFFADSYFQIKDYYLAAYQFESFVRSYPNSARVDEANFMAAKSYYMLSPKYSLDQKNTNEAIDKLQIFIDNYPKSEYIVEANAFIQELQTKLEKKDFEISKQYHTIRDYKASISSSNNFISSYPGTPFREDALYYKFLSSYEIAINSIPAKKLSRLKELNEIYQTLLRYYPETLFIEEVDKKMNRVTKEIAIIEKNITNTTTK